MKWVDLLMILRRVLFFLIDLGPLGLYEEIYKARACARDSCTSCATENTDYLTESLSKYFRFFPIVIYILVLVRLAEYR